MQHLKPEPGEPILLSIRGKDYQLRYPLRMVKQIEREHKISILRGQNLEDVFSKAEILASILAAGLVSEQPETTLDWVEDNVDASELLDMSPTLIYAITGRWPEALANSNGAAKNGRPEASEPGSASGSSPDSTYISETTNSGN